MVIKSGLWPFKKQKTVCDVSSWELKRIQETKWVNLENDYAYEDHNLDGESVIELEEMFLMGL